MKKTVFIATGILLANFGAYAQIGINESAKGESALLFRGTNIGLNITEAALSFGINNLDNQLGKKKAPIIGASASAKNDEGLGGIFSSGDFVPASKVEGFIGLAFSNGETIMENVDKIEKQPLAEIDKISHDFLSTFKTTRFPEIVKDRARIILSEDKRDNFIKKTIEGFNEECARKNGLPRVFIKKLKPADPNDVEITTAIKKIQKDSDKEFKELDENLAAQNEIIKNGRDAYFENADYRNIYIFLLGGINGSEFKRVDGLDSSDYNKSFKDEHFRGGRLGLGVNTQLRDLYIGATYAYKVTNNFDLLTKKEYTWKRVYTSGNQSLTQEKKISAYSDVYDEIEINELSADLAYNFRLDDKSKNHLLLNCYVRSIMFTRNSTLLPNKLTVGTAAYFFNNNAKFLGGLYVELADVNNNYEKMKPVDEQNMRKPLNRLSFGITTKFSLNRLRNTFRLTDESNK